MWWFLACERHPDPGRDPEEVPPPDADGDGVPAVEDCDDDDPDAYPGAREIACNGVDDDCDGRPSLERCDYGAEDTVELLAVAPEQDFLLWARPAGDLDGDGLGELVVFRGVDDQGLRMNYSWEHTEVRVVAGSTLAGGLPVAIDDRPAATLPWPVGSVQTGEFDGRAGLELAAFDRLLDARGGEVAVLGDGLVFGCVGDWNGDGVDGFLAAQLFRDGYHSSNLGPWHLFDGPFAGVVQLADGVPAPRTDVTCAGDTDSDGVDELLAYDPTSDRLELWAEGARRTRFDLDPKVDGLPWLQRYDPADGGPAEWLVEVGYAKAWRTGPFGPTARPLSEGPRYRELHALAFAGDQDLDGVPDLVTNAGSGRNGLIVRGASWDDWLEGEPEILGSIPDPFPVVGELDGRPGAELVFGHRAVFDAWF